MVIRKHDATMPLKVRAPVVDAPAAKALESEPKVDDKAADKAAEFEAKKKPAEPPATRPVENQGPVAGVSFRSHDLRAQKGAKSDSPTLTAHERLLALVQPPAIPADAKPAPSESKLKQLVRDRVGHLARHLSAGEIAVILGNPQWSGAIAKLGDKLVSQESAPARHFLLAAHLARWMEGIFPGATLDDVVKSFQAAHQEASAALPYLDAELLALLQRAYPFLPSWPTKPSAPSPKTGADAWLSAPSEGELYAERLENALGQLAEVPLTMKLTGVVGDKLAARRAFANHNVVMVQHMLGQANPLVGAMVKAGLDVAKAEYVGVPYQNNPAVQVTLERGYGMKVTVPERGNIDSMWEHVTAAVDRAYQRHKENGEPILILDDGGYASKYIMARYQDEQQLFKVVEQTTRGLTEISQLEGVEFPIVNVAGSYGKRFESAQVGDAVVQAVRNVLDELTTTPARKDVLVVGAGKVGLGVAESFKGDGAKVSIYDPYLTPARKKELRALGYRVIDDKADALNGKFLVVGCSGHRSIDMSDFAKMSSPVFLAQASSKRVEIDTIGLSDAATKDGVLRRILAAKVNEQETWHYWLQDGRIVTALADGLPVNFQDVNSIAPELIDHTMALMLLAAGQATVEQGKGLCDLDAHEQFRLQAQLEGLGTSRTSDKQLEIKVGDTSYFGDGDTWQAVARSPATPPQVLHALYEAFVEQDPMHPLCLAAVGASHELSDRTVDDVLARGNLAHVARLLKNEYLSDAQEDRALDFVWQSYADIGWDEHKGHVGWRPVGVTTDEAGEHLYWRCRRPVEGQAWGSVPHGTTENRDVVLSQLGAILFPHARVPGHIKENALADPYRYFRFDKAENVHLLANESWRTDELDKMAREICSAAWGATSGGDRQAPYAYDLVEALRDHPSSSAQVRELADDMLATIKKRYHGDAPLRGRAGWEESALGVRAPHYR